MTAVNHSLIPKDALTRKMLARVLAEMIRDDFYRLRDNPHALWFWRVKRMLLADKELANEILANTLVRLQDGLTA